MLTIGIEFLTGKYTASNPFKQDEPEWPPHPGRLFMAMTSSYFDAGGENEDEKKTLQWFEGLKPPSIHYNKDLISSRGKVATFVPINDEFKKEQQSRGSQLTTLEIPLTTLEIPLTRLRKQRIFPTMITGYDPIYFVWEDLDCYEYLDTLKTICSRVHRLGHSSSFVSLTVGNKEINTNFVVVTNPFGGMSIRWIQNGFLNRLVEAYKYDLPKKGKSSKIQEKAYNIRKARLNNINLPVFKYSEKKTPQNGAVPTGQFSDMAILSITNNFNPSLLHTYEITKSLRDYFKGDNNPECISGLDRNGKPSKEEPHIAIIPLAFTGNRYSDGLIRGFAIVIPNAKESQIKDHVSEILFDDNAKPETITIKTKNFKELELSLEEHHLLETLKPETWKNEKKTWATITPIVLDRVPHVKKNELWNEQVEKIISKSCTYQNLPEPNVSISNVSFLRGVPTATKFPKYTKNRVQVHALLEFETEIKGPLIIGAGRYNGYGLCKPWWDKRWLN